MLKTKIKNKLIILFSIFISLSALLFLVVKGLNDNILFFKTPSEIFSSEDINLKKKVRVGGIVKAGSVKLIRDEIHFTITDNKNDLIVIFKGSVPNLFVEGKGAIAEGKLSDKKILLAERILAKHDENYMPPDKTKEK